PKQHAVSPSRSSSSRVTRRRSERASAPGVVFGTGERVRHDFSGGIMRLARFTFIALPLAAGAVFVLAAGAPRRQSDELRVCVDPYDMPLSNDREEGFENKIAHVVASDLNARVVNFWWPQRRGFLRSSILAGFCDVMIQAPVGLDPVPNTKPHFPPPY